MNRVIMHGFSGFIHGSPQCIPSRQTINISSRQNQMAFFPLLSSTNGVWIRGVTNPNKNRRLQSFNLGDTRIREVANWSRLPQPTCPLQYKEPGRADRPWRRHGKGRSRRRRAAAIRRRRCGPRRTWWRGCSRSSTASTSSAAPSSASELPLPSPLVLAVVDGMPPCRGLLSWVSQGCWNGSSCSNLIDQLTKFIY